MPTKPRIPMYEWQVKPKRKRYVSEGRCIDCGNKSNTFRCDECNIKRNAYMRAWRKKNIDSVRKADRKWRANNKDKVREQNRKKGARIYDMSVEEYDKAILKPCGICGTTDKKRGIDHCHVTNIVRGTLCLPCNSQLGWYEKNKESIAKWLNSNT